MELTYAVRRPDCIAHRAAVSQCICGALAFDRFTSHKLFTTSVICIRHSPFSLPLWPSVRPCVLDLTSMCHLDPGLDHFLSPSTFLGPRPTVCIFLLMIYPAAFTPSCSLRPIARSRSFSPVPKVATSQPPWHLFCVSLKRNSEATTCTSIFNVLVTIT